MTLNLDFKVIIRPIDVLNVVCAQLTRDLFAIAKFLFSKGDRIIALNSKAKQKLRRRPMPLSHQITKKTARPMYSIM